MRLLSVGIFLLLSATRSSAFVPPSNARHLAFTTSTSLKALPAANLHADPSILTGITGMEQLQLSGSLITSASEATILNNPVFWSCSIMIVIVTLLYLWDSFLELAKEETPQALIPVINSMLAEMGSLGFIGLVLGVALHKIALGDTVAAWSEQYLGNEELLLESFEFLHEAFFQVAVVFFAASATLIYRVTQNLNQITTIAERQLGKATNLDGTSQEAIERLAQCFEVYELPDDVTTQDSNQQALWVQTQKPNPAWKELTMPMEQRGAEALIIRERISEELNLGSNFRISNYLEGLFAENNLEIVELSPLVWLPLIPFLAVGNALDLTHGVINAESANAAASSGYFFSTPWVLYPSVFVELVCLSWGAFNFWKLAEIKSMLMPTLIRHNKNGLRLLQPAVECEFLRSQFDSTPSLLRPYEKLVRKEPTTIIEALFGEVGANGPAVYLNGIKFQTWFNVVNLFFFSSQILSRDVYALMNPQLEVVGDLPNLAPEIIAYGTMVALNAWQLYLAPTTFLNLCLVTSVDSLKKEWAEKEGLQDWDGTPVREIS